MHSEILLGKILQRFKDHGKAQVEGYNSFGYIRETENAVIVSREDGMDTSIPFSTILEGIEAFKSDISLYHKTPTLLRHLGISHVTSPVWALLHLLSEQEY